MAVSRNKPWAIRQASFRGALFYVEVGGKASGRRIVEHEYPKRDDPYAEDMGRRAKRFAITAYIIQSPFLPNYTLYRDRLIRELETEGSGTLVLPTLPPETVVVDTYSVTERRERGGMCEFEIIFFEAGTPVHAIEDTSTRVQEQGAGVMGDTQTNVDDALQGNNSGWEVQPMIPWPEGGSTGTGVVEGGGGGGGGEGW